MWKRFTELILWHIFGNLGGVEPNAQHAIAPHHPHLAVQTNIGSVFPGSDCNTPGNRQCWTKGFDINTNYEEKTPDGIVRNVHSLNQYSETVLTRSAVSFDCYK